MAVVEIDTLGHEVLRVYGSLTERQLRAGCAGGKPMFIAESVKVIERAIADGYRPLSMLCEKQHLQRDAAPIIEKFPEMTVYAGEPELLRGLTGYALTRGVLCAFERRPFPSVADICASARRICVADGVVDAVNIGTIFRNAAALGIDAFLLTPQCCDPLNRRALRAAMGTTFQVAWTWLESPVASLCNLGFKTAAMALTDKSVSIDDEALMHEPKLAIVVGNEGNGLAQSVIESCDYTVRIPMSAGVDSLNVATAAAIAFWQLRVKP